MSFFNKIMSSFSFLIVFWSSSFSFLTTYKSLYSFSFNFVKFNRYSSNFLFSVFFSLVNAKNICYFWIYTFFTYYLCFFYSSNFRSLYFSASLLIFIYAYFKIRSISISFSFEILSIFSPHYFWSSSASLSYL